MITAYFEQDFVLFSQAKSVTFFEIYHNQTWTFYETSMQVAAFQRWDVIGRWLHHLRRCIAVRSDACVVVILPNLECILQRERSRRAFVA